MQIRDLIEELKRFDPHEEIGVAIVKQSGTEVYPVDRVERIFNAAHTRVAVCSKETWPNIKDRTIAWNG